MMTLIPRYAGYHLYRGKTEQYKTSPEEAFGGSLYVFILCSQNYRPIRN